MIINEFVEKITSEMKKVIIGQDEVICELVLAFLSGGHILLEGVPGIAKTMIARTFAKIIGLSYNRVQFTPDLMPSDILGTMVFNLEKSKFTYNKGAVFTNILLADEINRATPKTQSALLEVMQEQQVTMDGSNYQLKPPFMVIATQNPIEFEGTYPLPEAQLDRFTMKININYPEKNLEFDVLKKFADGFNSNDLNKIKFSIIDLKLIDKCKKECASIKIEDNILNYILDIARASREHTSVILGVSTRAVIYLLNIAKYYAGYNNRNYVIPDDVKQVALPVLRHRIILEADAEIEGYKNDDIIKQLLEGVKVPR